jgi:hypothetical protein
VDSPLSVSTRDPTVDRSGSLMVNVVPASNNLGKQL